MNGSSSNNRNSAGRSFPLPYYVQSGGVYPGFQPDGTYQGIQNMYGSFNIPSMDAAFPPRPPMNVAPAAGMHQWTGSHLAGWFGSIDFPVPHSQIPHGSSLGHYGVTNRGGMNFVGNPVYNSSTNYVGGSIPGMLQMPAAIGNHGAAPGVGTSPFLGNADSQIANATGNVIGSGFGHITRSPSRALSMPGLASRPNLSTKVASGNMALQTNRLMSGGLQQQGSGGLQQQAAWNSCASGGGLVSQSHAQSANNLNSMAMLNDVNSNDKSPFGVDDLSSHTNRPNSAGGAHGQTGSMRQQVIDGTTSQQNQEFRIHNEDFPALPVAKGGNVDNSMDFLHKNQLPNSFVSMMQNQHFSMGKSEGVTLGGAYSSPHAQKRQQNMPSVTGGSDSSTSVNHLGQRPETFPSSNSMYDIQPNDTPDNGVRSVNNLTATSSSDQQKQQYQQRIPSSFQDQGVSSIQARQDRPDTYGLLGLLPVLQRHNPDVMHHDHGIDLMSLGLDMYSSEDLHKTFNPWSDKPVNVYPEFVPPQCYNESPPPPLNQFYFMKFELETLFYVFYSMPKDEAQLYAANELCRRGWFYHKKLQAWLSKSPNTQPLVKTSAYEMGSYLMFNPHTWETKTKENCIIQYDLIEKRPALHQH